MWCSPLLNALIVTRCKLSGPCSWGGRWYLTSLWGLHLQRMNDEGVSWAFKLLAHNTAAVLFLNSVMNLVSMAIMFIATYISRVALARLSLCDSSHCQMYVKQINIRPTQYILYRDPKGRYVFQLSIKPLPSWRSLHEQALGSTVQLILMESGFSKYCYSYQTVIRHLLICFTATFYNSYLWYLRTLNVAILRLQSSLALSSFGQYGNVFRLCVPNNMSCLAVRFGCILPSSSSSSSNPFTPCGA